MNDSDIRYMEWYGFNETVINPVGLTFVFLMAIFFFCLPRRYAIIPLIATVCFITHRQRFVIGGLDFSMLRIMIAVGFARVIARYEHQEFKLNQIDKVVICWVIVTVISGTLLWKTGSAFVNRMGTSYDIVGLYFLIRILVRDLEDYAIVIKAMIIFSIPIAVNMFLEQISGRNFFSFLGGVSEYNEVREGRVRSQAAFSHPILAGTFGAYLLPQVIGLWFFRKKTILTIVGIIAATIIVATSSSSGPAITYLAALGAFSLWRVRTKTRLFFWLVITGLTSLHIVMKAPVWHLIGRISAVAGSTGFHRVRLISAAVDNFRHWCLVGIKDTAHWGWGLQDTTNMYIAQGISGGILLLILFVTIIMLCFKTIGRAVKLPDKYKPKQLFLWGIGGALFVHAVSFMNVSYFGQFKFFMYLSFAFISTLSSMNFDECLQDEQSTVT